MPLIYHLTWEPKTRRWTKMFRGKRFAISCKQLSKHFGEDIPETKEGSRVFANRWWEMMSGKLGEEIPPHPHQDSIDRLKAKRDWARENHPEVVAELSADLAEVESLEGADDSPDLLDPGVEEKVSLLRMLSGVDLGDRLDGSTLNSFFGFDPEIRATKRIRKTESVPEDKTVGAQVARYLDRQLTRQKTGGISVSEFSNCRVGLLRFQTWIGAETSVEKIDAAKWESYCYHLLEHGPKAIDTKRKDFRYARNLIHWLQDHQLVPTIGNLDRRFRFSGGRKEVITIPVEEVKKIVGFAKNQLKLHILLMCNCGFTQQDIGELAQDEVNWESGRIKRKRSKTGDVKTVPVVDYLLWDETWTLLKRFRSGQEKVLLTAQGKPWVRDFVKEDGSRSRSDGIDSNYDHLKLAYPLKLFRKTSASLIDGGEHARYAFHFLGHAPSIGHKNYLQQNGPAFDEAIRWLGVQYGFTPR